MRKQRWENRSQNTVILESRTLVLVLAILVPITCSAQNTTAVMPSTAEATTSPPVTIVCPDAILTNSTDVDYATPTPSDGTSAVSCAPPPGGGFVEGVTVVVCSVVDSLNATLANCTFSVTVDTTPPNATFFNCSTDIVSNEPVVDYVEPVASDGQESLTVACRPYAPGSAFPEGPTNVVCTATDQAGNVAPRNCTFTVAVDTTRPVAVFTNCSGDILTNNATVEYDAPTASEDDDSLTVSCDPPSGFTFSENQATSVVCTASDVAGNVANETCTFNVTVDTTRPVAVFTNCPGDILTNNATVEYDAPTASEDDDSLAVSCDPPSGFTFPENQDTSVVCTAADAAGNVALETCAFNVTVDTTRPVAVFTNCSGDILTNNATVEYDAPTASEDDDSLTVSCDPPSGFSFPENQDTSVVCTAADAAGNVALETCTFNVTVDTSAPVLDRNTCPSDASRYADYATNSTSVTWPEPTSADNLDPAPAVACSPQSNTKFEIGATAVACTATDAAGNVATPPCTFQVNVTELRSPTIDTVSNVSNETMLVSWSSPDVVENFTVVYAGSLQDTQTRNTTLPGAESSYEMTGLVPGETYTVRVVSESRLALAESEMRKRTTELNAPTIASAASDAMRSMAVEWRAPPSSVVERYTVVYAGLGEDTAMRNTTVSSPALSASLEALLPGETYRLRVVARSGSVESVEVFAESRVEQETTVPMRVILEEIESTVSSVTAQWSPPSDPHSSLTPVIEYYTVACREGDPEPERVDYTASIAQASCVNLPSAGRGYNLTVASHSADKSSSTSIEIIALPYGVNLTEGASTISSVGASWSFPGGEADGFKISCSQGAPDPEEILVGDIPPSPRYQAACVSLSTPGGVYTMTVYVESRGSRSNSSHIQLTALPDAVSGLRVAELLPTSVTIAWTIPSSGIFTSFLASVAGGESKPIPKDGGTSYEASFTAGLVPGREYTFRVVTLSGDKESAVETVVQRTVPSAIEEFVSSDATKSSITVAWEEPTGDKDGYVVTIDPSEGTLDPREPLAPTATFSVLTPGKPYSVFVVTLSGDLRSALFGEVIETDPDFPGPVGKLAVDDVQLHSARVSFEEPTNPNGIITVYRITYSGEWKDKIDAEKFQIVTFQQVPKEITELLAGYTYTFTVRAINAAGSGQASSSDPVTTLILPPPSTDPAKPETIKEFAKETSSITVRFLDTYFSRSNGELITYTVIIAQEGADASLITDPPQTWSEVKDKTPIPPYQAFAPKPYPFSSEVPSGRRKRQVSAQEEPVILGSDSCQSSSGYCNGPLRDDTSYIYLFRVWNEAGYADTLFSEPVKTLNDISLELGVGLGLSCGILVLVLAVLILLVVRRKGNSSDGRSNHNEGNHNEGYDYNLMPVRRKGNAHPVRVEDFPKYFGAMKADSNYLFSEEYQELRPVGQNQTADVAVLDVNRSKNRFTNILPYDQTRVKLSQVDDEEGSDYINANFMPGYYSPREFIACQGPLPGTEDDMWRLVWEQHVSTVVMVTQLVEKGRVKCHKYWPSQDKPVYFGDIFVSLLAEEKLDLWTIREFELSKGGKTRRVHHFNFTAWPDHGVPENTDGILRFVRNVRNQIPQSVHPTLVHCSAGVGRTGTFICLDLLMLHLREHDYVDVFRIVSEMRMHRNLMVQTEDQYVFIHECLMDIIQGQQSNGSSPIYENLPV